MALPSPVRRFLGKGRPVYRASAPGRLDVMGGIGDYSGSLVLQMPIRETATVYLSPRADPHLRLFSVQAKQMGEAETIEASLGEIYATAQKRGYEACVAHLHALDFPKWSFYVIGCWVVLAVERGWRLGGADVWIDSRVPIGKGVASSAALEVSVLNAMARAYALSLGGTELPVLAQKVENRVAGAPCGLMDQLASHLGEPHKLLPILCQPDQVYPPIPIPPPLQFIGIDSGVRHEVRGASYSDVRTAAFMGYTIIARQEGVSLRALRKARSTSDGSNLPYGGYLANISPSLFESTYRPHLPSVITCEDFQREHGLTIDHVTSPETGKMYAVQDAAAHPVYEHHRVRLFSHLMEALTQVAGRNAREERWTALGEMMFQAHVSYSRCGLGHERTDEIVQRVREAGAKAGVYGARVAGGGSGGTVCVLAAGRKGRATCETIAQEYAKSYGLAPCLFTR